MEIFLLIAGLVLLLFSGEFLIRSSVSFAAHLKISSLVVGLVVVSFGTSAPELFVSILASAGGHPDISLGNIVGSNISNIGIVLGITVMIAPFFVDTRSVIRNWAFMTASSLLILVFVLTGDGLGRFEGLILLTMIILFVWFSITRSRKLVRKSNDKPAEPAFPMSTTLLLLLVSSAGLAIGAEFLVKGATGIARELGISDRVISVSVIAIGTSLPELVTSVMAAIRKQKEISIGNIIGSNIFNLLAILGVSSVINPIRVTEQAKFTGDMIWMTAISVLLMLLMLPVKGSSLGRWKGLILTTFYFVYIYLLFTR